MPFNEGAADQILEAISDGVGLVTFLKERPDLPSYATVLRWVRDHPEFAANYGQAREDSADHDADKISDVSEKVLKGLVDPAAARVAIDAYKWCAGRRRPKRYGDKLEIEATSNVQVTHTLDVSHLTLEELDVLERVLGNG
jgi:hypothetical protein